RKRPACCRMHYVAIMILFIVLAPVLQAKEDTFKKEIQPILQQYCYDCHGNGKSKGDLALDHYKSVEAIRGDRKKWEMVLKNVKSGEMPPEKKPQPSQAQRDLIAKFVQDQIFPVDPKKPDPGRVTIRRLNRAEYNNTIRDLVGVEFRPADDFPVDD